MKIELDLDELVGVMMQDTYTSFYNAVEHLHPEFIEVLFKRLHFLKDIVKAGEEHNHD